MEERKVVDLDGMGGSGRSRERGTIDRIHYVRKKIFSIKGN